MIDPSLASSLESRGVQPMNRSPARLIQDERPYVDLVRRFVDRRIGAAEFLSGFAHLWRCDGAEGLFRGRAIVPMTRAEASLYGTLDALNELCEFYWRSLPAGCGYRVSEEQFRKEIEREAWTSGCLLERPR
jgi:hypothetical protein